MVKDRAIVTTADQYKVIYESFMLLLKTKRSSTLTERNVGLSTLLISSCSVILIKNWYSQLMLDCV